MDVGHHDDLAMALEGAALGQAHHPPGVVDAHEGPGPLDLHQIGVDAGSVARRHTSQCPHPPSGHNRAAREAADQGPLAQAGRARRAR